MEGRNRRVVLYGHTALRTRARPVTVIDDDLRRLLADLRRTMVEQDGLGLAANQIGETTRAFAIDPRGADVDSRPYCVINPEVVATEGELEREEGCLSLPGIWEVLPRPELVRIRGLDETGAEVELEASGIIARAFLHELDHLNGQLLIDRVGPTRRGLLAGKLREIEDRERQECG
ncbi:peptide deformylase [candidate division WOR-3 bacterium]|nr:peptide deformylase [candidate division WOR-3 bacterium]